MVAVPARPRPTHAAAWIIPPAIAVGTSISLLWELRPRWGYCADGIDGVASFCDSGRHSLGALIGTVALAILLIVYAVLVQRVHGPRRRIVLIVGIVVLALACIAALILSMQVLEDVPMRIFE